MKQFFTAATIVAVAAALSSCDPQQLVVTDTSALQSISLQVSNETSKWEYGEERLFTIVPNPSTAICDRFEIKVSNPDIVSIRSGELPNQFKLTAQGEGKLIVTGIAVGHGEVAGQTGFDWTVEKTATEEFTLADNRVIPTRPVVNASIAPSTDFNNKTTIAEDASFVTDDRLELLMNVSSDENRATYSLSSSNSNVLSVERCGNESWILRTPSPGRVWLTLTVTDGYGNAFEYKYLVYVFGHMTMTAEYDPLMAEAGLSVDEHPYSNVTAQVFMAGKLYGWPWNDSNNIATRDIPTFTGVINLSEQFEYLSLSNTKAVQEEIYSMTVGEGINWASFNIHKVKLNYILTLSDPYIIIDRLIDDSCREESKNWDFWIDGAYQQNGIAKVETPQEVLDAENSSSSGWYSGGDIILPI